MKRKALRAYRRLGSVRQSIWGRPLLTRASLGYRNLVSTPESVVRVTLPAAAAVLIACAALLAFGPAEDFWGVFDHAAGALAITGLLLAFPALSYAASTERLARSTWTNLQSVRELPGQLREIRDLDAIHPSPEGQLVESQTLPEPSHATRDPAVQRTTDGSGEERQWRSLLEPWLVQLPDRVPDPDDIPNAMTRRALEAAITGFSGPTGVTEVLRDAQVYVLGETAGDRSEPGRGTESDILHFVVEMEGRDAAMMPLFTTDATIRDALARNPDWAENSILEVNGGDLVDHRDRDVTLVVDPWSRWEFQLPP